MPSGAKKRKAAKKKKEQQISVNGSNPNEQGNGDKRAEDERSSDSSEVNSPVSDGNPHHQRHKFGEGDGVSAKSGSSLDEQVTAESKLTVAEEAASRSKDAVQQNSSVNIKEDLKSAQNIKSLEVSIDSKKVFDDERSSISSSTDKQKEVDITTSASETTSKPQEDTIGPSSAPVSMSRAVEREMEATQDGTPEFENGSKENEDVEVVVSDKTLTPSGVAESSIDAKFSEPTENQPLVGSAAPRLAQRTSWLSCCGLFGD
ncbi:hypothetical protein LINPERHAP1_LOCUS25386 [Linum perenne]